MAVVLAPDEPILIDDIQPVKRKGRAKAAIFDALKNDFSFITPWRNLQNCNISALEIYFILNLML